MPMMTPSNSHLYRYSRLPMKRPNRPPWPRAVSSTSSIASDVSSAAPGIIGLQSGYRCSIVLRRVQMPAITADTLTLARISAPGPADTERPVRSITTGPRGYEGEGFPVVRAFAGVSTAALDPFVHMDQMGEVEYQPGEPRGTDWHPHRGFETVTYMIDGRFAHQDSHGGGGLITDGATQWMTAGSGILHIETPPAELVENGGVFHGIQLWVN